MCSKTSSPMLNKSLRISRTSNGSPRSLDLTVTMASTKSRDRWRVLSASQVWSRLRTSAEAAISGPILDRWHHANGPAAMSLIGVLHFTSAPSMIYTRTRSSSSGSDSDRHKLCHGQSRLRRCDVCAVPTIHFVHCNCCSL